MIYYKDKAISTCYPSVGSLWIDWIFLASIVTKAKHQAQKNKHNKNIEVQVRLAYSYEMAIEAGKKVIRKSLEEETELAHDQLEELMNW